MKQCSWAIPVKRLVRSKRIQLAWCAFRYPGHPKGCPNLYGRCARRAPYIDDVLDVNRPMWLVFSEFDLAAHVEKMRVKHPDWTERQLRNVLYWQRVSKKQARNRGGAWAQLVGADYVCTLGEAAGVNLFATARISGLKLEKIRRLKVCRHIVIVGWRKR